MTIPFAKSGLARLLLLTTVAWWPVGLFAQTADVPLPSWVSTWGTSQTGAANDTSFLRNGYRGNNVFNEQTIRLIIHTSLGGPQVRVRLSNEFGTAALSVGAVHVALQDTAERIVPGSDRAVTFNGKPGVTIPAGAPMLSDPVEFDVPPRANLAVSIYLAGAVTVPGAQTTPRQATYVAPPGSGNTADAEALPLDTNAPTVQQWPLLTGVEVFAPNAGTFVAFGSSITSGVGSTAEANHRWPDYLAKRLARAGLPIGVANASISANKLLFDGPGQSVLARFDRDVLSRPGVRYVLITDSAGVDLITAVNDPLHNPSVDDLAAILKQVIERAHSQGIKVFAGTILPVEGFIESAESRTKRLAINDFLRSGVFDGVADFEQAVLDPENPFRILPSLDSGDHHHPNDEGYRRMAKTVLPLILGTDAAPPASPAGQ